MTYDRIFFSGSGARIASHLGAACALEDKGIRASVYQGISGGAFVAMLAYLGMANRMKETVLTAKAEDIFSPPVFDKDGKARLLQIVWGFIKYRGKALTKIGIDSMIDPIRDQIGSIPADALEVFVYDSVRKQIDVIRPSGDADLLIQALVAGASYPGLCLTDRYSDAGVTLHFPDDNANSLYFSTAEKPNTRPESLVDHIQDIISRQGFGNATDQKGDKGRYFFLPAMNGYIQYNEPRMRESFRHSYNKVRDELDAS